MIAAGRFAEVASVVRPAVAANRPILIFDDETGHVVDLDLSDGASPPRGPGRPKLGVSAREVTLLPRHWEWLSRQPGGASAALRRLVEAASRETSGPQRRREAQETVYRVSTALAGDAPGYEEAMRALFAGDSRRFEALTAAWPPDVAAYARGLAAPAFEA